MCASNSPHRSIRASAYASLAVLSFALASNGCADEPDARGDASVVDAFGIDAADRPDLVDVDSFVDSSVDAQAADAAAASIDAALAVDAATALEDGAVTCSLDDDCLTLDPALVCRTGVCRACGGASDPCCADLSCAEGQLCDSAAAGGPTCVPCGREGEPCCAGASCVLGQGCEAGVCIRCGAEGERCCPGSRCVPGASCGAGTCHTSCPPVGECDVVFDRCGAAEGCYLSTSSSGSIDPLCAPRGTALLDEPCTASADCVSGHFCAASGTGRYCVRLCCGSEGGNCPVGGSCSVTLTNGRGEPTGFGVCAGPRPCSLLDATRPCRAGEACYPDATGPTCVTTGTTAERSPCSFLNDCMAGLACTFAGCQRLCDPALPASCAASPGTTCNRRDALYGTCAPP